MTTLNEDDAYASVFLIMKGFDERGFVFYTKRKEKLGKECDPNKNAELWVTWEINWDGGLIFNNIHIYGELVRIDKTDMEEFYTSMD